MLKRIYIHNYRTFVGFEWHMPRAAALVGENGGGKSALIEVLSLLQDVVVGGKRFADLGFPSTRNEWLGEPQQIFEIELDAEEASYRYRIEYGDAGGRRSIREELHGDGRLLYHSADGMVQLFGDDTAAKPRVEIPFDRHRSFLSVLEPRPDNQHLMTFVNSIRSIWAIKPDPPRLGCGAPSEATWLERDLSNFAGWYRAKVQEDPDASNRLREDLCRAVVGFDQLRLEPISPEQKVLLVRFAFGQKPRELSLEKLSEGQRLLIGLYGLLRFALPHARLLALDETENYLAPAEIQPWLRLVVDAAAEGGRQLLVVSHHSESINYLAADSVFRMWRDPSTGYSRIAKLEPDLDVGETAYDLVKEPPDVNAP